MNVALLHGLHAGPAQLAALSAHLRSAGHRTVVLDFATTRGIDACVTAAFAQLAAGFPDGAVHVVGFSFGSLVGRGVAHRLGERCPLLVQVAPPNRGAAWARRFAAAGAVLGGVRDLVPGSPALSALPVPPCPIAVLAGTSKLSAATPITWPIALANLVARIDEPGDGAVTLAETELPPGSTELDRLLLPFAHDHLPHAPQVHDQAHVLQHGRFRR